MRNGIRFTLVVVIGMATGHAVAANYFADSTHAGSTTWSGLASQNSNTLPGPNDTVTVGATSGGMFILTVDVSNAVCGQITVGNSVSGTAKLALVSGSGLKVVSNGSVPPAQPGVLTIGSTCTAVMVDISLGGTLQADKIVDAGTSTNNLITGSGTVILTGTGSLPSKAGAGYNIFNVLTIASGTTTLAQQTQVTTLNLGNGLTSGTIDLGGNNLQVTSALTIQGGNANTIKNTSGTAANLSVALGSGTTTYNGAITGNLQLIKDGFGTLVLSGGASNTYTGGTQIFGGTIQLTASNSLPVGGALTLGANGNGGTLDLNGFNQTVQSLTIGASAGAPNIVTSSSGNAQFTIKSGNALPFYTGVFTGSLSVSFDPGSGNTFTVDSPSGANTYTGNTNISSGTLLLNKASLLPGSTSVAIGAGATLDLNGKNQTIGAIGGVTTSTIKSLSVSATTLTVGSGSAPASTFDGPILGANLTLTIDNGQNVTLNNAGNSFGALNINNGSLKVGASGAVFSGIPVTLGSGGASGTLDINGNDLTIGTLQSGGGNANIIRDGLSPNTQGAKTLTTNILGGPFTYNGQCTAKFSKTGSGALILSQGGGFTIMNVQDGTVKCGAPNIFTNNNSVLTLGSGISSGVFDVAGNSQNIGTIGTSGSGGSGNMITDSGIAATLNIQNNQNGTPFSFDGSLPLSQLGLVIGTPSSSPFTFAGTGFNTGSTIVGSGPLIVTGSNTSSALTINGPTGGPLSGTGSVGALTATFGAIVSPGSTGATGQLFCAGADLSGATLQIRILNPGAFDVLNCNSGQLKLNANSHLVLDLTGFPSAAMSPVNLQVALFSSRVGDFSQPGQVTVMGNSSGYEVELDYSNPGSLGVIVGAQPAITTTQATLNLPASHGKVGQKAPLGVSATNNPFSYTATPVGLTPVNPPGLTFNTLNGTYSGQPTVAGTYTYMFSATNKGGAGPSTQLTLTIDPGDFTKLQILLPGEVGSPGTINGKTNAQPTHNVAGVPFPVVVNAVDAFWNVVPSVNDNITFASNDLTAILPATPVLPLSSGSNTYFVTLLAASPPPLGQPTAIGVSDAGPGFASAATSANVPVDANVFQKYQLLVPGEVAAPGTVNGKTNAAPLQQQATFGFNVKVNAVDQFWNVVSSNGNVVLTSSDPLAVLPPSSVALNNGTATIGVTLNLAPSQTITAADAAAPNFSTTSATIPVRPGNFVRLQVLAQGETNAPGVPGGKTGTPTAQTGGTQFQVTVNAVDANFTIVDINDVVHLSSSDSTATLASDAPLLHGTVAMNVTLFKGPTQTVTASDNADVNKTSPPSSSIPVSTVTCTLTAISPDAGVLNGPAFTLTVTGTNFLSNSVIQWNGSTRPTTFVSATQLTAAIPASDLTTAGRASVTVFTTPPGTGSTAAISFFVYSGTTTGTWIVTNTNDSGQGSLRFAMSQMRTGDMVIFDPNVFDLTSADAATVINVLSALPTMNQGKITIDAQDRRVSINGSGAGSTPGLEITSSNNTILGLGIVGFTQSGIQIHSGAQNNVIGGSRLTGTGPNGQGLRLSNNGSYGLEINDVGTTGNVVKGCWIGLDSAGTSAEPNLAGIIIQNGAQLNVLGGTGNGESNVISGNKFEGITITGSGTDNNTILGNIVGMSGVTVSSRDSTFGTRAGVGNGSAGIFLSKGTQGSTVGGDTDSEGNLIGSNGGNGIEVRAKVSKHNKSRGNRISNNARGGIALFDGSNDGIQPPTITTTHAIGTRSSSTINGRATTSTQISGTASSDGVVEVFNDTGSQGTTLIGRSSVSASQWNLTADVDTTQNITATFTDLNGNTSAFAVYSPSSGATLGSLPSDLSAALSALTPDPATTLFGGDASSAALSALTLNQLVIKTNLTKSGQDTIQLTASLPVASGFSFSGQAMAIDVGGVAKLVTFNSKGTASGAVSAKFAKAKNGTAKFTAKFSKGAYASTLSAAGLGSASATVALNVYIVFNKTAYGASPNVSYEVKTGKSGSVKFAQK